MTIQVSKTDACRDSGLESGIGVPDCETTPRTQHAAVPLLTTHCVSASAAHAASARLCSEKNYRLQDIQLSKIRPTPRLRRFVETRRARKLAASPVKVFFVLAARFRKPFAGLPAEARIRQHQPTFAKGFGGHPSRASLAKDGGEYRARTGDLLVANQALSQLS